MITCNNGTEFQFQAKPKCNDVGMFGLLKHSSAKLFIFKIGESADIELTHRKPLKQ